MHATFTEFGDAGKRWRFLEALTLSLSLSLSLSLTLSLTLSLSLTLTLTLTLTRWRFLEAGLWGALPAAYFTEGRYLSFTPPLPPPDPAPCRPG